MILGAYHTTATNRCGWEGERYVSLSNVVSGWWCGTECLDVTVSTYLCRCYINTVSTLFLTSQISGSCSEGLAPILSSWRQSKVDVWAGRTEAWQIAGSKILWYCSTRVRGPIQSGTYCTAGGAGLVGSVGLVGLFGKGVLWLHSKTGQLRLDRSWRPLYLASKTKKALANRSADTGWDDVRPPVLEFPRTKTNQRTTHRWTLLYHFDSHT